MTARNEQCGKIRLDKDRDGQVKRERSVHFH